MSKILEVENLATYFHTFKGVVKSVDRISFSMEEGEVLGEGQRRRAEEESSGR